MSRTTKRPVGPKGKRGHVKSSGRPARRPTNLSLDAEAVARGEQYAVRHGTSLSQLVSDFLRSLAAGTGGLAPADLAPAVWRLHGIAAAGTADRKAYREHLLAKYGGAGQG